MKVYSVHYLYDLTYNDYDPIQAGIFSTLELAKEYIERGKKDSEFVEEQGYVTFYISEVELDVDYRFKGKGLLPKTVYKEEICFEKE